MIRREIETGERNNPPAWAHTFPSAYFHLPDESRDECLSKLVAIIL
jgi:hypothetical protein